MYFDNSTMTLNDCKVEKNTSKKDGGGIYCVDLKSSTMKNCKIRKNTCSNRGGSLNLKKSEIKMTKCYISDSKAKNGAGAYIENSQLDANDCTFTNNYAEYGGGSLCFIESSKGSFVKTKIFNSRAKVAGGGIYCINSSPSFETCQINSNKVTNSTDSFGAGICCQKNSTPSFKSCLISKNKCTYAGGGIALLDGANVNIESCTVSSNSARFGGGIYLNNCTSSTFKKCTVSSNNASEFGGGVYSRSSCPTFNNCKINNNKAGSKGGAGGGVYYLGLRPRFTNGTKVDKNDPGDVTQGYG